MLAHIYQRIVLSAINIHGVSVAFLKLSALAKSTVSLICWSEEKGDIGKREEVKMESAGSEGGGSVWKKR